MEQESNLHFGKLYLLIIATFILNGCTSIPRQKITYQQFFNVNSIKNLKVNGYFYSSKSKSEFNNQINYYKSNPTDGFVLYQNGLVYNKINDYADGNEGFEKYLPNELIEKIKITKWGAYKIENDNFYMQAFILDGHDFYSGTWAIIEFTGKIENDSTITLKTKTFDKKQEQINRKFTFRQYSPKPDSTNIKF